MAIASHTESDRRGALAATEWAHGVFLARLRRYRLICTAVRWLPYAGAAAVVAYLYRYVGPDPLLAAPAGVVFFILRPICALGFSPLLAFTQYQIKAMLRAQQERISGKVIESYIWGGNDPGSVALTAAGSLVMITHNWNYTESFIGARQIAAAKVERRKTHVTDTHHGGSFSVGSAFGSSSFGSYNFGSSSRSVTHTIEDICLEIQAQVEPGQPVATFVVPFGDNRRAAEELCTLVNQFREAA